jgi:ABC-2 type transport system permease protein
VTKRILAMLERYVILHFRSPVKMFDLFFWPVMELIVWGFITIYLQRFVTDQPGRMVALFLTALIFWDVLFRSQQAVSLAFMEELWTRNVINLFISPLKLWEWVAAASLYGIVKTGIITAILLGLSVAFYSYAPSTVGIYFIPFIFNLLLFGGAMGLLTTGLLLRWGHQAEVLIWGVPFLIQPFSAIFYPLSVYPAWLKPFCMIFPSTYVLEGMREVVTTGHFSWGHFGASLGLNVFYMALFGFFFIRMFNRGRVNGGLVRITG